MQKQCSVQHLIPSPFTNPAFLADLRRVSRREKYLEQRIEQDLRNFDALPNPDRALTSARSRFLLAYRILARCAALTQSKSSDNEQAPLVRAIDQLANALNENARRAGLKAYAKALAEYSYVSLAHERFDDVWDALEPLIRDIPQDRWLFAFINGWRRPLWFGAYMAHSLMPYVSTLRKSSHLTSWSQSDRA